MGSSTTTSLRLPIRMVSRPETLSILMKRRRRRRHSRSLSRWLSPSPISTLIVSAFSMTWLLVSTSPGSGSPSCPHPVRPAVQSGGDVDQTGLHLAVTPDTLALSFGQLTDEASGLVAEAPFCAVELVSFENSFRPGSHCRATRRRRAPSPRRWLSAPPARLRRNWPLGRPRRTGGRAASDKERLRAGRALRTGAEELPRCRRGRAGGAGVSETGGCGASWGQ